MGVYIVSIVLVGGLVGMLNFVIYNIVKFGVVGFLEVLWVDLCEVGVGVLVLCLGLVKINFVMLECNWFGNEGKVFDMLDGDFMFVMGMDFFDIGKFVLDVVWGCDFFICIYFEFKDVIK